MNEEDEDLMVTLFFIAFTIFIVFFVCLAIAAIIWSFIA